MAATATYPFDRYVCLICGAPTGDFYICDACQAQSDYYEKHDEPNEPEPTDYGD